GDFCGSNPKARKVIHIWQPLPVECHAGRNQDGLDFLLGQFQDERSLGFLGNCRLSLDNIYMSTCHTKSGKSTIATNLGVCGEEEGETVLIVDLDPQHSATLWHSARGTNKPTVIDAIPEKLRDLSHETGRKQQELIAEALNMLFVKHGKRRVAS